MTPLLPALDLGQLWPFSTPEDRDFQVLYWGIIRPARLGPNRWCSPLLLAFRLRRSGKDRSLFPATAVVVGRGVGYRSTELGNQMKPGRSTVSWLLLLGENGGGGPQEFGELEKESSNITKLF